MKLTADQRHGG